MIIDWGNACLAPPMLDLANIVELGSPEWATYVAAYEAAGGAFDAAVAERAYWWARAIDRPDVRRLGGRQLRSRPRPDRPDRGRRPRALPPCRAAGRARLTGG